MSLFDQLTKVYTVPVKCSNCNHRFELKVRKGTTIEDYLKSGMSICENCGCTTLKQIIMNTTIKPAIQENNLFKPKGL